MNTKEKELQEERELRAFMKERKEHRKKLAKQIIIIVVVIGLIFAFALPSLSNLIA